MGVYPFSDFSCLGIGLAVARARSAGSCGYRVEHLTLFKRYVPSLKEILEQIFNRVGFVSKEKGEPTVCEYVDCRQCSYTFTFYPQVPTLKVVSSFVD